MSGLSVTGAGGLEGTGSGPLEGTVLRFCSRYVLCVISGSFQECSTVGAQALIGGGGHAERQAGQIQGCYKYHINLGSFQLLSTSYMLDTEVAQGIEMPASRRCLSHQTRQSLPFGGSSWGCRSRNEGVGA